MDINEIQIFKIDLNEKDVEVSVQPLFILGGEV
jgi:hypothetical protein